MHIPDGQLCPLSIMGSYAIAAPIVGFAVYKARKSLNSKFLSILAIGILFSIAVMSVHIHLPGGSTGHVIGTALLTIVFGPWIAILGTSIALCIQAVFSMFFADGGLSAIAANIINIAVIPTLISYFFLNVIAPKATDNFVRKVAAAGIGGYFALIFAVLATGLTLKYQPEVSSISVSNMVIEHLLYFGWLEAFLTSTIFALLVKQKAFLSNLTYEESKS